MKTNRSMPASVVIPVLAYANVREAVDWLCRAFGFVERLRIRDHQAQLSFGSGAVVIAGQQEALPQGGFSHAVMVRVADIDSHSIDGHLWTFSETIADVDPDLWGGTLVE
jgi:hypothetical protein